MFVLKIYLNANNGQNKVHSGHDFQSDKSGMTIKTNKFNACCLNFTSKILLRFDVIKDVLEVVYLQVVTWIGSFYSPLLPFITTIALFLAFYLKIKALKYCITKESIELHAYSKHGWFFFTVLYAGFICSTVIIYFSIGFMRPSMYCHRVRT